MKLRDMQAAVSIGLLLMSVSTPQGIAQQTAPTTQAPVAVTNPATASTGALPVAPAPVHAGVATHFSLLRSCVTPPRPGGTQISAKIGVSGRLPGWPAAC